MLVETSALCAILLEEPDWRSLAMQIAEADYRCTTSVNVFEAILALSKQAGAPPTQTHEDVVALSARLSIEVLPFTPEMIPHAVIARDRYGRSRKGLNMGDCLSYAAARHLKLRLLYKGDDFAKTDVND